MFKPPKGIKYDIISKDQLLNAMDEDDILIDLAAKRIALKQHIKELQQDLKEKQEMHKKSFWSLYKAEADLAKAKIRTKEKEIRFKNQWTKRVWELFKLLKFSKLKIRHGRRR